jgi:hypothetical protein
MAYVALLFLSLGVSLKWYIEIVDPALPTAGYSFWESRPGELLWLGAAFLVPAVALLGFRRLMRDVWRGVPDE